jgi:hypothetical protein
MTLLTSLCAVALASSMLPQAEPADRAAPTTGTSVTIYSSADVRGFDPQQFIAQQRAGFEPNSVWGVPGFGVVRETREVSLKKGLNALSFTDVAAFIDPTTVGFVDLTHPTTSVIEQRFEFDLVSPSKLYERYVGREVRIVPQAKPETAITGVLLAANQGQFVIDTVDGLAVVPADGVRVELLGDLPGGLLTKPTLLWTLNAEAEGKRTIRTTYQTAGLTWRADYNLVLNATDSAASLMPWVTLLNVSGAAFENTQLRLVAGDVQRVQAPQPMVRAPSRAMPGVAAEAAAGFEEESLLEYHLYTLPRPASITRNATQQLALFPPVPEVKVQKELIYVGAPNFWGGNWEGARLTDDDVFEGSNRKVGVFVTLKNDEASGLGKPLPKGRVRVYKAAGDGTLEFVGEDVIDHTPKNESIRLKLGDSFDVTGKRTRTNFRSNQKGKEMVESFRIELKNAKREPQKVEIRETLYRWSNWDITEKSQDFRKLNARAIAFDVEVPAEGSTTVEYTVRYTW